MRNAALHALGPDLQLVSVYFVPAQPTDLLASATGEQTQPHDTVVLTTSIGGFPDCLQFLVSERSLARLLHVLGGKGNRVAICLNQSPPQAPCPERAECSPQTVGCDWPGGCGHSVKQFRNVAPMQRVRPLVVEAGSMTAQMSLRLLI